LNLRPLGYEPSELPSCSTPRRLQSQLYVTYGPPPNHQVTPPAAAYFVGPSSILSPELLRADACADTR
jgi:hypothetical protein